MYGGMTKKEPETYLELGDEQLPPEFLPKEHLAAPVREQAEERLEEAGIIIVASSTVPLRRDRVSVQNNLNDITPSYLLSRGFHIEQNLTHKSIQWRQSTEAFETSGQLHIQTQSNRRLVEGGYGVYVHRDGGLTFMNFESEGIRILFRGMFLVRTALLEKPMTFKTKAGQKITSTMLLRNGSTNITQEVVYYARSEAGVFQEIKYIPFFEEKIPPKLKVEWLPFKNWLETPRGFPTEDQGDFIVV